MAVDGGDEMFVCKDHKKNLKYITILKPILMLPLKYIVCDTTLRVIKFQSDNAHCHKEATMNHWFNDCNIVLLDWSVQFSNLNPFEYL